ncbi:hypothetical protein [Actinomadura madurae]|uniref:hypothetical protein n=1 Tax=Actinomadura madurae TaxID=1993 RepID=UPI0020D243BB|nr:hypothetical protein [Actinomadura madurae]MCQ0012887.1 hypothetical protein [Actinomadura madurae]
MVSTSAASVSRERGPRTREPEQLLSATIPVKSTSARCMPGASGRGGRGRGLGGGRRGARDRQRPGGEHGRRPAYEHIEAPEHPDPSHQSTSTQP